MRYRTACVVLITVLCLSQGCAKGTDPFLVVQLCLRNEQGVSLFMNVMRSIAQSQQMTFVDGSATTQEDLISLKENPDYKLVNIGIERKDGMGLTAGNLGLGAYQVAIGFSKGLNSAAAHRFANLVVNRLKQRWHVYVVPAGRGALPLKACGKSLSPLMAPQRRSIRHHKGEPINGANKQDVAN